MAKENSGDRIRIHIKDKILDGILMPNKETDSVVIKLDNGYNVGIDNDKITKIEVIKKQDKPVIEKKMAIGDDRNKKYITILHTGGTIASRVDYKTGGVTAHFSAEDLVEMVPELKKISNIETELVANMMSEDMLFSDYQKIAGSIKKHTEKGAHGIIIGHGTDTLAYTAAALSFMFEKINIPILIVGAQRSSDRGSSDAASNLICAANFITKTDFVGVGICMHHTSSDSKCAILPAAKTRKMHTSRRDAFKPINDTPIALVDYANKEVEFIKKDYRKKSKDNAVILKDKFENRVGLLKTHTNMKTELFEFFAKSYKGIVIEGTGLGHVPTNLGDNIRNYEILKKFIQEGGIVAITSQCIYGRVHKSIYTNLRRLSNIGCIFCEDMLPETTFLKLSWLLGNYSKKESTELLTKNLRGEINPRLEPEHFVKSKIDTPNQ